MDVQKVFDKARKFYSDRPHFTAPTVEDWAADPAKRFQDYARDLAVAGLEETSRLIEEAKAIAKMGIRIMLPVKSKPAQRMELCSACQRIRPFTEYEHSDCQDCRRARNIWNTMILDWFQANMPDYGMCWERFQANPYQVFHIYQQNRKALEPDYNGTKDRERFNDLLEIAKTWPASSSSHLNI